MKPHPLEPDPAKPGSKAYVLGLRIDAMPRIEAIEKITALIKASHATHLVTANSLMALEAENNEALRAACNEADLSIPDSSGLTWAARVLRQPHIERFPGVDIAFELCHRAAEDATPVYLLGGAPSVADRAGRHLCASMPGLRIAGVHDGFFEDSDEATVIEAIRESGARLVLVGLGMPRQELWIHRNKGRLPSGLYIGVGGTFDIWAGRADRAPIWMQDLGFEWLFRLVQEPWRAKRMLGLPMFALRVWAKRRSNG